MTRLSADERRDQLVEAAIAVMIRDGVAKATTRAIATEAGAPLGAFHYCFRSKQELLHAVIDRIMRRTLVPTAAPSTEDDDRPPYEIIRETLHAYWDGIRRSPAEQMVTYELTQYALRQPDLTDVARRQYAHYLSVYGEYLEAVARAARIHWTVDVPVLARHGLGLMDGLTLNWLIDRDDAQAEAALDEYARYLGTVAGR
ncbi:TetR/AcrR family transcriptional regulator [Streptomyces sp. NPDC012637]|uniref:TetR/AcrR family transcriptional regulator n=1 Tax=Streptomyces sp. NPDC012637 TaxID=3364842 RepID=UPI0036E1041F